ncbi:hypothetical protein K0M31_018837, partial [Melipona bicolor]
ESQQVFTSREPVGLQCLRNQVSSSDFPRAFTCKYRPSDGWIACKHRASGLPACHR